MKKLDRRIILFVVLAVCLVGCCDIEPTDPAIIKKNWMIANCIGLFLTVSAIWFANQFSPDEDIIHRWKLWHILLFPCGYIPIAGIVLGAVMWMRVLYWTLHEKKEEKWCLLDNSTLHKVLKMLNSDLSLKRWVKIEM